MDIDKLKVGETLEELRKAKNITTQEAFAELCGIDFEDYQKIISKNSISVPVLEIVCKNIDIPLDIFRVMAMDESKIENSEMCELLESIRPLMNKISKDMYIKRVIENKKNSLN